MRRSRWIALLVLAGVALVAALTLPWRDAVGDLLERARALGPGGALLIAALFVPACVLMLPGAPITVACAAAFGFGPSLAAVVLFSNLGAQAAFATARWLLRERIGRWVRANPRLAAVDRAIGEDALRTVFLLRLSPLVPFNALNYALGASPVRFAPYALGTLAGMIPGTVLYCYAGAALGEAGQALTGDVETGIAGHALMALGLLATLLVVIAVTRRARRALREILPGDDGP